MARNDKRFLRPCAFLSECEENFARAIKSAGGLTGKDFHVNSLRNIDFFRHSYYNTNINISKIDKTYNSNKEYLYEN